MSVARKMSETIHQRSPRTLNAPASPTPTPTRVSTITLSLEEQLDAELDDARLVRLGQRAEVRGAEVGDERPEVRVVEKVEDLAAELNPHALGHAHALHHGEVDRLGRGHLNQVARDVADEPEARGEGGAVDVAAAHVVAAGVGDGRGRLPA